MAAILSLSTVLLQNLTFTIKSIYHKISGYLLWAWGKKEERRKEAKNHFWLYDLAASLTRKYPVLAHSYRVLVGHYFLITSVVVVKTISEQRQTYLQLEGLLIN